MIVAFDTETTGKQIYGAPWNAKGQPHIVQLGAILFDEQAHVKGEINLLIKPNGWTIPAETQAIHGISTEDCEKYGVEIRSALGIFNAWLKFSPLLVAHNISFDEFLVEMEVQRLGKAPILTNLHKYCTMKQSTNIVKAPKAGGRGYKRPKLQETHKFLFGSEFEGAHDAMADVRACARCYFEMNKTPQPDAMPPIP